MNANAWHGCLKIRVDLVYGWEGGLVILYLRETVKGPDQSLLRHFQK